jgi:hypothetical protein
MFDGVACSMCSRYGMLPDHRPLGRSADVVCPASLTLCSALSPIGSDRHP